MQNIDSIRAEIYSLTEEELNEVLGRPEQTLLYERGQKFYEYKINCEEKEVEKYLRVRINALGYVNEVLLLEK
ncbi:hypothetical protein [Reichenbachiella ulvae]|uniref:SmpA / OmlA family protein n=1 Tax=Reichenbachiella ulvae TaxID=2980104 RepID=A0ABT3CRN9_9BACT|nr:hypothetical protein [Reichenbachiella ulvae]MCV9386154.1 hypothetical protein [Reichenbachiella ulvae]